MTYKKILDDILKQITPEDKKIKEVDDFVKKLKERIKSLKISAKAVVGGSFAKETFLKQDHDVDIFVVFSTKYKDEELSNHLKKILTPFKPETVHGSRDYFTIKNDLNFEIVPVMEIKNPENAKNVTDFSPEHVKWFKKNSGKYKKDVMIAKKFCKGAGVYGAESYINGFSGHVLDIIVVYYKGFIPLLKNAAKWKPKKVIDFYNIYKGKALFELNKSKTQGSLIVVDPVQQKRNAAAALSEEKFKIFADAAKKFLQNPSSKFFVEKKIDKQKLKEKNALILEIQSLKGKVDVVGAKLLKAFEFVKKELSEFGIKDAGWEWDKQKNGIFWFITKEKKLPDEKEWEGPPLILEKRVKEFKKKYKKTFTKKGRIYARIKRKHTTPEGFIKDIIQKQYFKEKVDKCRKL